MSAVNITVYVCVLIPVLVDDSSYSLFLMCDAYAVVSIFCQSGVLLKWMNAAGCFSAHHLHPAYSMLGLKKICCLQK